MARKIAVGELLRLACVYAENDQRDFLEAIRDTDDQEMIARTKQFVDQIRAYRLKRWGRTKLEGQLAGMTPVKISEIVTRGQS